jgi:uncharacterized Zn-finger protein
MYAWRQPVIKTHDRVVRCSGEGRLSGTGHPPVYIQLKTRAGGPIACKYCSQRYELEEHH